MRFLCAGAGFLFFRTAQHGLYKISGFAYFNPSVLFDADNRRYAKTEFIPLCRKSYFVQSKDKKRTCLYSGLSMFCIQHAHYQ